MNYFRLVVQGETFNVDRFLRDTTIKFDGGWRRGDNRLVAPERCEPETNGIFKVLGRGEELSIDDQERLAVAFINSNRESIVELVKHPGVETVILGLQYGISRAALPLAFSLSVSRELSMLSVAVGIAVVFYVEFSK